MSWTFSGKWEHASKRTQEVNTDKSDAEQVAEPKAWMQKSGGNSSTKFESGNFPHGPVGKTLPSHAEGAGSLSGQGANTPHALRPK